MLLLLPLVKVYTEPKVSPTQFTCCYVVTVQMVFPVPQLGKQMSFKTGYTGRMNEPFRWKDLP